MQSSYRENGFLLKSQLFSKEEVSLLKSRMEEVFRRYSGDYGTEIDDLLARLFSEDFSGFHGCAQVCGNLIELSRLATSSKITDVLSSELNLKFPSINTRPLVSLSCDKVAKNFSYWKIPAHQDWPSMQGSLNGVTCWVPLVDVEELGPLEVVPSSHLEGPLQHCDHEVPILDAYEENRFVPVPMKAGDGLFFSCFLVHRSGFNYTSKIRWSVHFRYDDVSEDTFIERKLPRHNVNYRKKVVSFPGFPTTTQLEKIFQ